MPEYIPAGRIDRGVFDYLMGPSPVRHIQYCEGDLDITGSPYDREDANEVRVWEDETLIVAVRVRKGGQWEYAEGPQCGDLIGDRDAALALVEGEQA